MTAPENTRASVLVGYTATKAGADAAALGARLAQALGARLELVLVLPSDDRTVITPPDAGYDDYLRAQAATWLADAARVVPAGIPHAAHVRYAESFAEGLEAAAVEFAAGCIVVGAANGSLRGRHRLGSTATALVHSAGVAVVLAPRGARKLEASPIPRLTVAIGTRPGAETLLETAVRFARLSGATLRLVSLVSVDLPPSVDTGVVRIAGAAHADEVLARARAAMPDDIAAEAVVGRGESIEDAVAHLDWLPGELVLVGSSRLAQPRTLFLGQTAAKMLRELPVPLVVVPSTPADAGVSEKGRNA